MKLEAKYLNDILLLVWAVLFITIPLLVNNEKKVIWQIIITAIMLALSLIIENFKKHESV
ncbi:hypothetical protein K5V21_03870 [Clostridium sardiniense]|uniref:Uncharacterized protein n=1 Tax=Clostridium sardiniense TaxID=29369 RepID=A0ABS7KUU6_CLOSR|nr:hypothetical protein [Clostridium sardiniense]MBY0754589.1 hypothetical protein [Clostridium sardiniense]MDQ0460809.1 hypothetical protein [Clostridium sardiniense]